MDDAQIEPGWINLQGAALTVWFGILRYAAETKQSRVLLQNIVSEQPILADLVTSYLKELDEGKRPLDLQFGLAEFPSGYSARIARLIADYLGDSRIRRPFGGRSEQLAMLNSWLEEPVSPSKMLLSGQAGRGKTALLIHWLEQVSDEWSKIFLPISIRYDTNSARIVYESLAVNLSKLVGTPLLVASVDPAEYYKEKCYEYLAILETGDRKILLVLDGLDEAVGWEFDPALLSLSQESNIKVVVSARWLAGEEDGAQWLYRLGWAGRGAAQSIVLDVLSLSDIEGVLATTSTTPEKSSDVAKELKRVSQGDPLLLGYLIEDMETNKGTIDLDSSSPGFASYFAAWLDRQRPAWLQNSANTDALIGPIMGVLSCALGPIGNKDLSEIVESVFGEAPAITKQTLIPLARFVIGSGTTGYSLSHPKLSEYFQTDFFQDGSIIERIKSAYIEYGRREISRLNDRSLSPRDVSTYLLKHLSGHFQLQNSGHIGLMELVSDGWRLAWEQTEDADLGFARDVAVAMNIIVPTPINTAMEPKLSDVFRCALCLSSITSLGRQLPIQITIQAAKAGIISLRKVCEYARLQGPAAFPRVIAALASRIPDDILGSLLEEAVLYARLDSLPSSRVTSLAILSILVDGTKARSLLDEALLIVETEQNDNQYADCVAAIAPFLPSRHAHQLIKQALERTKTLTSFVNHDLMKVEALKAIAPHISRDLVMDAVQIEKEMSLYHRLSALSAISQSLTADMLFDEMAGIFTQANDTEDILIKINAKLLNGSKRKRNLVGLAASCKDSSEYGEALKAIFPHLPRSKHSAFLANVVQSPRLDTQAEVISSVLSQLPDVLVSSAVSHLMGILPKLQGTSLESALNALALHASDEDIKRCVEHVAQIVDLQSRANCMAALVSRFSADRMLDLLRSLRQISDNYWYAIALATVSEFLPTGGGQAARNEALACCLEQPASEVGGSLVALSDYFPFDEIGTLLSHANRLEDPSDRLQVLASLISKLSDAERGLVLGSVWESVLRNDDFTVVRNVCTSIAGFLSEQQLSDAPKIVIKFKNYIFHLAETIAPLLPYSSSHMLLQVADILSEESENEDLDSLLELYMALFHALPVERKEPVRQTILNVFWKRGNVLHIPTVACLLEPDAIEKFISDIAEMGDSFVQCQVLSGLLPYIGDIEREEIAGVALSALSEAMRLLKQEHTDFEFSSSLMKLVPYLDELEHQRAIAACESIVSMAIRAETMCKMLAYLCDENKEKVVHDVYAMLISEEFIRYGRSYGDTLNLISQHFSIDQKKCLLQVIMRKAGKMNRDDFLAVLKETCRVALETGEVAVSDEIVLSLIEIRKWYP
ncbi:MAG: ATP-binding protein [Phyllobacterium sp.]|uniref:ATP-binding protein n=1 Tax=Phyllobacterium sp. TaxID=1871046 RepID=UPI0030F1E3BA